MDPAAAVWAWLEPRAEPMAALLEALVAIDTQNPPGRDLDAVGARCATRWPSSTSPRAAATATARRPGARAAAPPT